MQARRGIAIVGSLSLVLAGLAAAPPAVAADCSGSYTADTTCTLPGSVGTTRNYLVTMAGGGGGYMEHSSEYGGNGGTVTTTLSLPAGTTLNVYVGQRGLNSGEAGEDNWGGGGGGSSAIVQGSTLLAEAGGGGGGSYGESGGAGGGTDGAGEDAPAAVGECEAPFTNGKGGNQPAGSGAGGLGGILDPSCTSPQVAGADGNSASAAVDPGQGGNGGSTSGAPGTGTPGGAGYSDGGNAGGGASDYTGGGGGGGYGGGGGGAFWQNDQPDNGGGGGGSYVHPAYTDAVVFAPANAGPGYESSDGEVSIDIAGGPIAQTELAAPTSVTKTSAALHSMVNANASDTTSIQVRVSTSPTFASGVMTASISPSGATGASDTPIDGTIAGLSAGTTYYYQVIATNADGTVYGLVESFDTEPNATAKLPLSVKAKPVGSKIKKNGTTKVVTSASTSNQGRVVTRVSCRLGRGDVRLCRKRVARNGAVFVTTYGYPNVVVTVRTRAVPKAGSSAKPSSWWKRSWQVR